MIEPTFESLAHPWEHERLQPSGRHATLLALLPTLQTTAEILAGITLRTATPLDIQAQLDQLTTDGIVVKNADEYRLAEPLSWFSCFDSANFRLGLKGLLVSHRTDPESEDHLYLCDIRNPRVSVINDTITYAVTACGKTMGSAYVAFGEDLNEEGDATPTCNFCYHIWCRNEGWRLATDPLAPPILALLQTAQLPDYNGHVLALLIEREENVYEEAVGKVTIGNDGTIHIEPVSGYQGFGYPEFSHQGIINIADICGFNPALREGEEPTREPITLNIPDSHWQILSQLPSWFSQPAIADLDRFIDEVISKATRKGMDNTAPGDSTVFMFDHAFMFTREQDIVIGSETGPRIAFPQSAEKHRGMQDAEYLETKRKQDEYFEGPASRRWHYKCANLPLLRASITAWAQSDEWSAQISLGPLRQFVVGFRVPGSTLSKAHQCRDKVASVAFAIAETLIPLQARIHERFGPRTSPPEWNLTIEEDPLNRFDGN